MADEDDEKKKDKKEKAGEKGSKEKRAADAAQHQRDSGTDAQADAPSVPTLGGKVMRTFVFTFLATFLTALLFADSIPNGLRVDFDLIASIKLGLIAAVIAVVLRAVAGMLPLFPDDHAKKKKKDEKEGEDD